MSALQATDARIDAAVAWDGLAATVTPRAPALGLSSDEWIGAGPPPGPVDGKLAGFAVWQQAGLPTGELTIAGASHRSFESDGDALAHQRILHPTLAWLDRWLAGDAAALDRIASATWDTTPRADALSAYYTSAMSTPEYACPDLTTG